MTPSQKVILTISDLPENEGWKQNTLEEVGVHQFVADDSCETWMEWFN